MAVDEYFGHPSYLDEDEPYHLYPSCPQCGCQEQRWAEGLGATRWAQCRACGWIYEED